MVKDYIEIGKSVVKGVIIVSVTTICDTFMNNYYWSKPSNSVDGALRHIGACAIGIATGDKVADVIISKAETLYHAYEEARD